MSDQLRSGQHIVEHLRDLGAGDAGRGVQMAGIIAVDDAGPDQTGHAWILWTIRTDIVSWFKQEARLLAAEWFMIENKKSTSC